MKVLVTGGAGFIGSFTVDRLIESGHQVRIFDSLDPQVHEQGRKPKYLNKDAEFIKGDVRDIDAFEKALRGVEGVFHFAACVGVGQSQYQIKKYADVTIGGTSNLLDILVNRKNKVRKVVVAASMSSYGEGLYSCKKCGPVRPGMRPLAQLKKKEWEPRCPSCGSVLTAVATNEIQEQQCNSIYSITKKVQEDMVLNIGRTYKIPSVALRFFNVYGPRQALSNPYTGVCAIFLSRIKNDNRPVVYEDGLQTRDFISVHDIVSANILALTRTKADYQVFNVGSGVPLPISAVAQVLIDLYKKPFTPEIAGQYRKGDIRHCYADITKLRALLHFTPKVGFKDGMRELLEWSREERAVDGFIKARSELKKKGLL
ncbi:MAG: SDR family NAD(P)-dependent oxidoreductase [Candidatus Omnitrophota bacterium]